MNNLMKTLLIVGGMSLTLATSSCEKQEKKEVREDKVERTTDRNGQTIERTETTRQSE